MIRKNIYSRITESIVNAYHDNNLDSAMEDGHEMENMGKKIVAIITADPDQDLDWESEYEPFGATELTDDDESECCEHDGIISTDEYESEHDLCPSCGYDVDCEDDENDDMEDLMIGGGFESNASDDLEDVEIKEILIDILDELRDEDSDESDESDDTEEENPMFDDSNDEDEWEEDDADTMLAPHDDWYSDDSDDEKDEDDSDDEDYDEEEDMEEVLSSTCKDDVEVFDSLDN